MKTFGTYIYTYLIYIYMHAYLHTCTYIHGKYEKDQTGHICREIHTSSK